MEDRNVLGELWNVALTLIESISKVFDWLFEPLKITVPLKIPVIMPKGLTWDLGVAPIALLGVALIGLVVYWLVWA
ncbi:MAG: hypothetical protein QXI16_05180 [Sulfolobaceae archaeon]